MVDGWSVRSTRQPTDMLAVLMTRLMSQPQPGHPRSCCEFGQGPHARFRGRAARRKRFGHQVVVKTRCGEVTNLMGLDDLKYLSDPEFNGLFAREFQIAMYLVKGDTIISLISIVDVVDF